MARITQLQDDLNALLLQETKANTEKHLVLSMLQESYIQKLNDIGYGYHTLVGFYQEAVEVLASHFQEHKLSNLLTDSKNKKVSQKLLHKALSNKDAFSQRWGYLDFENALSRHVGSHLSSNYAESYTEDNSKTASRSKEANYPLFTRPFFIALKNMQS